LFTSTLAGPVRICVQVLATTFAVSHNVPEAKPLDPGPTQASLYDQGTLERDWGVQQLMTSASKLLVRI
jgi:hypothetical protein